MKVFEAKIITLHIIISVRPMIEKCSIRIVKINNFLLYFV